MMKYQYIVVFLILILTCYSYSVVIALRKREQLNTIILDFDDNFPYKIGDIVTSNLQGREMLVLKICKEKETINWFGRILVKLQLKDKPFRGVKFRLL